MTHSIDEGQSEERERLLRRVGQLLDMRADEPATLAFLSRALYGLCDLTDQLDEDTLWGAVGADSHVDVLRHALSDDPPKRGVRTVAADRADLDADYRELLAEGAAIVDELLHTEGAPLSAEDMAAALNITRQGVNKRRMEGKLLAIRRGRGFRYPRWQLGADDQPLVGLEPALAALDDAVPVTRLQFFLLGAPELDGRRPLDALRAGELDKVLRAARLFGRHGAP